MIPSLSHLPSKHSQPPTPAQRDFAQRVRGSIKAGCLSQCQVITKTHVYLVTRAGLVRFSSKRSGR